MADQRFIDPEAEFFFVPADRVLAEAEHPGATPFDGSGAKLNHRGELVTFEAMLDDFRVRSPVLSLLGKLCGRPIPSPRTPIRPATF